MLSREIKNGTIRCILKSILVNFYSKVYSNCLEISVLDYYYPHLLNM